MTSQRSVQIHGHRRAYEVHGHGSETLLLLHGIGSDARTWQEAAPALGERFTVIVPDLLGHGRSAKPRADYSIGGYANGMRDLLTVLGIDRVTVVGHSFGGGVAMQLTYQFPDLVERLVLVSAGGLGPELTPALRALTLPGADPLLGLTAAALPPISRRVIGAACRRLLPPALAGDVVEALSIHEALGDPAARRAFLTVLRHVADVRGQLITMRDRAHLCRDLPVLIVWGADDHAVPAAHAQRGRELFPQARSLVLPGVGHFPHREAPERFVREVIDFVARTRPARLDPRWRETLVDLPRAPEIGPTTHTPVVAVGEGWSEVQEPPRDRPG